MKSIKKRFRVQLSEIMDVATQLSLLAEDIELLMPVQQLSREVLQACHDLEHKARKLDKLEFVEQIGRDDALLQLLEMVDQDVVSSLEEIFAKASADMSAPQLSAFLQQLLDKLEKRIALMSLRIQQLGGLLNATAF